MIRINYDNPMEDLNSLTAGDVFIWDNHVYMKVDNPAGHILDQTVKGEIVAVDLEDGNMAWFMTASHVKVLRPSAVDLNISM